MGSSNITPIHGRRLESVARSHLERADLSLADLIGDLTPMLEAPDLPDLWAGLARSVLRTIRSDACAISLIDLDGTVRDAAACVVPPARLNLVADEVRLDDFPATRRVVETGQGVEISVSDPLGDRSEKEVLEELGFARLLICRLSVDGLPIGIVEAYRVQDRPFRQDDVRQVDVLCAFAANAYSRIHLAAKLEGHYIETLGALASALEAKDPYTQEHTGRIRELAVGMGAAMQLSAEKRHALSLGAILHDVGKIGIADSILLKPGPLNDEEWSVMREHPVIGERMLHGIDFLAPALPIIRHHHERWDGSGYPDGLKGEDIPIGARIVAVCDAFDAMTSDRRYRKAMPLEVAFEQLLAGAGSQFDRECAILLVDMVRKLGEDHLEERFVRYASPDPRVS
ncbi:MAG: HD domain-containing protein [Actinomycetota bacterium]|nr:HD domain-containing protein [Actinomycetota bacterium]